MTRKPTADEIVHGRGVGPTLGRAYCGRRTKALTSRWARVSCEDCQAALRADKAASMAPKGVRRGR